MECSICCDNYELKDISWLPCSHYLCNLCFYKLKQEICPFCRANFTEVNTVHSSSLESHFLLSHHHYNPFESYDIIYSNSAPARTSNISVAEHIWEEQVQQSRTTRRSRRRQNSRHRRERNTENQVTLNPEISSTFSPEIISQIRNPLDEEIEIFTLEEDTKNVNDTTRQNLRNRKNHRWTTLNNQRQILRFSS